MSLQRFCRKKVVAVTPEMPVVDAARMMTTSHVGGLVVVDSGHPVGMLTDRDLVTRVMAQGRDAQATRVDAVMSRDVVCAHVEEDLDAVALRMNRNGVRRLPIVDDDGALTGMVTLDDVMVLLSAELSTSARAVRENRGP